MCKVMLRMAKPLMPFDLDLFMLNGSNHNQCCRKKLLRCGYRNENLQYGIEAGAVLGYDVA